MFTVKVNIVKRKILLLPSHVFARVFGMTMSFTCQMEIGRVQLKVVVETDKTRKASNQIQFRLQIDVLKVNCLQCELERIFINLVGVKQADFI